MAKFLDKTGLDTFWAKIKSTFQTLGNLVTSWSSTTSDTKYPSEKLVKDSLDAKVSSITKNGTSITPTNGVADIGSMPVTRGESTGTVQEIIQAVRVKAGGSLGSVNVSASTVGSVSIPGGWYNFIWLPHQNGRDSGDSQHYGTLILTPLTESPDVYVIEGSALNGSSPTYRAKRLAYYDHTHSNLVPEGDNRSVSTIPNDYSNTFVFRGIKNNSAIDSPSSDVYSYVIGLRGYQNSSGGRAHEIAFNDSGVFFRSGSTTSWTAWGKLVTDETLFLYANLGWGGKFRTSLSPVDVYLFYSQNAFFGLKPSAVNVEYSNDGGTTWADYGLTDDQKRQLFSQYNSCSLYCGKAVHVHPGYTGTLGTYHDLSDENIADQRLRITLCCLSNAAAGTTDQTDKWIYCNLRRLAVYMSTQSASKGPTHFKITGRRKTDFVAGNDVWHDLGDYGILGDSGWNSVPCLNDKKEDRITFGNSYDNHYTQLRFEIWSESLNTSPNSGQTGNLLIQRILGFSELLWQNNTTNSNMATYGAPYTVNPLNGVTHFSKGITSGVAIPIGSGGTGQTNATAAQYALLNDKCTELTAALSDDYRFMFATTSPSTNNGVFVGFRKASAVWTYIKGKISSVLGLSESNGVKTFTGNAATATTATNVSSNGAASNSTARHIWFSDSTTETKRVHDDNFMYTPSTNTVSANISGNAATASAAQSGSALETAINGKASSTHTHGNITNAGGITASGVTIANGDSLVIVDSSETNKLVAKTSVTFDGSTTTKALTQKGTFETFLTSHQSITGKMNTNADNAASGALQNLTAQLSEGTDAFTDGTEVFSSYASDSGFASTDHVNQPYRRKASAMWSYIKSKLGISSGKGGSDTPVYFNSSGEATACNEMLRKNGGNATETCMNALLMALPTNWTATPTDDTYLVRRDTGGAQSFGQVKFSTVWSYIYNKLFYVKNTADSSQNTHKRIQLGYASVGGSNVGFCCYLVHIFFNYVDGNLKGCGVTALVTFDWRASESRLAKLCIVNDNGMSAAGYNIVLANFLTDSGANLHITIGLVKKSASTTLVQFSYSYCRIVPISNGLNWTHSVASDTVGTYDFLIQGTYEDAGNADSVDGYHIQIGSYSSRTDTISLY